MKFAKWGVLRFCTFRSLGRGGVEDAKMFVVRRGIGAFKILTCFTFASETSKGEGTNKGSKETEESPFLAKKTSIKPADCFVYRDLEN